MNRLQLISSDTNGDDFSDNAILQFKKISLFLTKRFCWLNLANGSATDAVENFVNRNDESFATSFGADLMKEVIDNF